MGISAITRLTVPFHDVDIMNIVWHGHYFKYFEIARTTLARELGLDWPELKAHGVAMPIVEAHVQYRRPLAYGTEFEIEARIEEYAFAELRTQYAVRLAPGAALHVAGWTRQVYVDVVSGQTLFDVPELVRTRCAQAEQLATPRPT